MNLKVTGTIEIGRRLRAARERRGWNRETLAYRSGMSWSAITQIESGRRRNARPSTLSALADALGVTLDYLIRGASPPPPMLDHRALIYDSDDALLETAGGFIKQGSERGESVLAVMREAKIDRLRRELGPESESVEFVASPSWYTAPGAALDGYRRFCDRALQGGAPWVRIVGEPIWEGRTDSEVEQWTRYESLLNLVFAASPIAFLCPYDARALDPQIVEAAHLTHPQIADSEGHASSGDYADPARFALDSTRPGRA